MWVLIIIFGLLAIVYVPAFMTSMPTLQRFTGVPVALSYMAMMAAAAFSPSPILFLLIVLILFVATVRDRLDAACRLLLMSAMLPNVSDHVRLGSAYLGDFSLTTALTIALIVAVAIKPNRPRLAALRGLTIEDALVAALVLIFWLGPTRFPSLTIFLRAGSDQVLLIALPYLALRHCVRSSAEFLQIMICFAFGMVLIGILALYEARMGWAMMDPVLGHYNLGVALSSLSRGGAVRAAVTQSGALMLGFTMLMGIATALYARGQVRSSQIQLGWIAMMVLGILAAQSRGNLALVVLALLIFCVVRRKWGWAAVLSIGAPIAAATLVLAAGRSSFVAGFLNLNQAADPTQPYYDYRQLLLERGMEEAARNRWFGASMDTVLDRLDDIQQGQHIVDFVNTYLTLYLVSGLVGLAIVVVLMVAVLGKLLRPLPKGADRTLRDAHGLALTIYILAAITLTYVSFYNRVPFFLMVTLIGSRIVGIERVRLIRARRQEQKQARFDALPLAPARHGDPATA